MHIPWTMLIALILLAGLSGCSGSKPQAAVEQEIPVESTNTATIEPTFTQGLITVTGDSGPQDSEVTPTEPFIPTNPVLDPTTETANGGDTGQPQDQPADQPADQPPDGTADTTDSGTTTEPSGGGEGTPEKPRFDQFVDAVKNGKKDQIVGVYVDNKLALRVVQQPPNNPAFVSTINGVATQFLLAFKVAKNIGLLAHNYLAGGTFFNLTSGDLVEVVYGDGTVKDYLISEIYRYQALSPRSPTSDFLDLDTAERLSANSLFYKMYGGEEHLTFQTCIQEGMEDSWGRLFVIATPQ